MQRDLWYDTELFLEAVRAATSAAKTSQFSKGAKPQISSRCCTRTGNLGRWYEVRLNDKHRSSAFDSDYCSLFSQTSQVCACYAALPGARWCGANDGAEEKARV